MFEFSFVLNKILAGKVRKQEQQEDTDNTQSIESKWVDESGEPTEYAVHYYMSLQSKCETYGAKKSTLNSVYSTIIYLFLSIFIAVLIYFSISIGYFAIASCNFSSSWVIVVLIMIALICIVMFREVKTLSKADKYNVVMFIIAIVAIVITVSIGNPSGSDVICQCIN